MSALGVVHCLKTHPSYFKAMCEGVKSFEIRKNDRGFEVGHHLRLFEFIDGLGTTGWYIDVEITYICDYMQKDGYVVLGTKKL